MRLRLVARSLIGLLIVALVAAGVLLWSQAQYNQWPWASYPETLSWCGRDWLPSGVEDRRQIESEYVVFRNSGDLPGWLNRGKVWTGRGRGATGLTSCRISEVWVQIGSDRFESMNLSGGP